MRQKYIINYERKNKLKEKKIFDIRWWRSWTIIPYLCGTPASKKAKSLSPHLNKFVLAWFFNFKSATLFKSMVIFVPNKFTEDSSLCVRKVLSKRKNIIGNNVKNVIIFVNMIIIITNVIIINVIIVVLL